MKAVLVRLSAVSLICAPVAVPNAASAQAGDPVPDIASFCKELSENFPQLEWTPGTCLASFIADGHALDNFVCTSWQRKGLLDDFGFKNVGECVKSGTAQP